MQAILITLLVVAGVLLLVSRNRKVRRVVAQLRLLRRSMRKEFRRLEAEAAPVPADGAKVSIEG
ncbi:MAG: hypothetical protein HYV26_04565 [Candidatus Hydrogenedentes bacterium]|nr:hypothetical protein [Candidatus Hydrogenedentota bacterium]MBI3118412.1 hypothetical protein [Candidatus Hydrogenedentota bacterium]